MQGRGYAAAALINDDCSLLITGGRLANETRTNSTEVLTLKQDGSLTTSIGPDLPVAVSGHCLIRLNRKLLMVIGGSTNNMEYSKETYTYNQDTNEWSNGPDLEKGRENPACAMFGNNKVVVAGGNGMFIRDSTEIWTIGSSSWTSGPDLPQPIKSASMIATVDSLVLVGGLSEEGGGELSTHFRFTCSANANDNCSWEKMEQALKIPRQLTVAMVLPEEFTNLNCTEK